MVDLRHRLGLPLLLGMLGVKASLALGGRSVDVVGLCGRRCDCGVAGLGGLDRPTEVRRRGLKRSEGSGLSRPGMLSEPFGADTAAGLHSVGLSGGMGRTTLHVGLGGADGGSGDPTRLAWLT